MREIHACATTRRGSHNHKRKGKIIIFLESLSGGGTVREVKRHWKILIAVTVIPVLIIAIPMSLHYRAKGRLAAYRKQLITAGEKQSVAGLMPKRPEGKNGANDFRSVPALSGMRLDSMKVILPGKAEVVWQQPTVIDSGEIYYRRGITNFWPVLRDEMAQNSAAVAELRASLRQPAFYLTADGTEQGIDQMLPHLSSLQQAERELCAAALSDLHAGETKDAHENILATIALPRVFKDEPVIVCQLVRYACIHYALQTTWEALQFKGWSDEQLAAWQKEWEGIEIFPQAATAIAMFTSLPGEFDQARESIEKLNQTLADFEKNIQNLKEIRQEVLTDPGKSIDSFIQRYPRYHAWAWIWSYDEERETLQLWWKEMEAIRAGQNRKPMIGRTLATNQPEDVKYMILPEERASIQIFSWKVLRAQTLAQMAVAAIALQRYHLLHHRYPASLAELEPIFLKEVPIDYMDGKELRYRSNSDGTFLLYSAGDNGQDDGGDPNPPKGEKTRFLNGQDWVWPQPATAEEVKEFEDKEAQSRKK